MKKLSDDGISHIIGNGTANKDNSLFKKAGVDIVSALAPGISFNNVRDYFHVEVF
jgi:hypothetical protein